MRQGEKLKLQPSKMKRLPKKKTAARKRAGGGSRKKTSRPPVNAAVPLAATTPAVAGTSGASKTLLSLLESKHLVLRLDEIEEEYLWCTNFIAVLVWFAAMFEEDFVFRGHSDARWNLQPKMCHTAFVEPPTTFEKLVEIERSIVREVQRAAWLPLRDDFSSTEYIDFISVLQHKGIATRLIDVTADPLVATFFASLDDTQDGAVISILRHSAEVRKTGDNPVEFVSDAMYTVWSPPPIDSRMIAQRGEFLLINGKKKIDLGSPMSMTDLKPKGRAAYEIDRIAREYFNDRRVGRPVENAPNLAMFVLPKHLKGEMRRILTSLGLNAKSLFPDLQGYAARFGAG